MKTLNISAIVLLLLLIPIATLSACGSSGGSSASAEQTGGNPDDGDNGTGDGDGNGDTGDTGDDSGGDSTAQVTHSVPAWMIGSWLIVRLRPGDGFSFRKMFLTVTDTGFEYHYPDCDIHGTLSLDVSVPYFASNDYELLMTLVDCVSNWDIPSFVGATDEGHLWADNEGDRFFRISDSYSQFTWVYTRQ